MENINPQSEIQNFYNGKSILITGSTGFLGRVLLEKLLRSCNPKKIYLLIRPRYHQTPHERLKQLLEDKLFNFVKKEITRKEFNKIHPISGDLTSPQAGISTDDIKLLTTEVSIIFHAAALTKHSAALSVATVVNIFGTLEMLKLAAAMANLKCFLYVSNAFCFTPLKLIEEKVYEGRFKPLELLRLFECENVEEKFETIEGLINHGSVTFTKGLGENLVNEFGRDVPVCIFRPSLIISSYQEPFKNYQHNQPGLSEIVSSALHGSLRTFSCNPDAIANLVPVDLCVNCILTIAWEISKNYQPPICLKGTIPVYQFESSHHPITWKQFFDESTKSGVKYPPSKAKWCCTLKLNKHKFPHYVSMVFQHLIPAILCDFLLFLARKKSDNYENLMKTFLLNNSMEYVTRGETKFVSRNVRGLLKKINEVDKKLFNFDLKTLNWSEYFELYFLGIRLWSLEDPLSTVKVARKRYLRFQLFEKLINLSCVMIITYISYCLYVYIFCTN